MSLISLIHPSRGRPDKSFENFKRWMSHSQAIDRVEFILSIDQDEPTDDAIGASKYITLYNSVNIPYRPVCCKNRSAIDAINNAAKIAKGDVLMVISDDTEPCDAWIEYIYHEANGKTDWILKTQDGIQPWIITMPIMDRVYYNRTGYIYHPDYLHMFCDTELTCVADITGRKITSNLLFPHKHYSVTKEHRDELHVRNDDTWKQGEKLFLERYKRNFDLPKGKPIQDKWMIDWLQRKVR